MDRIIAGALAITALVAPCHGLQLIKEEISQSDGSTIGDALNWTGLHRFKKPDSSLCKTCEAKWTKPGRLVFVGVFSAPEYRKRREEVRSSWMSDELITDKFSPVQAKFILGSLEGNPLKAKLLLEQQRYGDMVFLPVKDSYEHLPQKTLAFFSWFNRTKDPTYFAMKLDDDTFPNFNLIVPKLETVQSEGNYYAYFGGLQWHGPVQRQGKWAETKDFKGDTYPAYMAGSGYALSNSLVRSVLEIHHTDPKRLVVLRNEDTTIGNFIHQEHFRSFIVDYVNVYHDVYGCKDMVMFAMNLWPGEMKCMWDKRLTGEAKGQNFEHDMCCRPLEKYGLSRTGMKKPAPSLLSEVHEADDLLKQRARGARDAMLAEHAHDLRSV